MKEGMVNPEGVGMLRFPQYEVELRRASQLSLDTSLHLSIASLNPIWDDVSDRFADPRSLISDLKRHLGLTPDGPTMFA
jgi:hypothetical protein